MYALIKIVEGNFWAAAARGIYQPIVLSVGTLFTALKLSDSDEQPLFASVARSGFNWNKWFAGEKDKKPNET